jgi:hypothetical protein
MPFATEDRRLLRELARRVAEVAAMPIQEERRQLWKAQNALRRVRPLILVFPEGSERELLPPSILQCEGEPARKIEYQLRRRLYFFEHLHDDKPVENEWLVSKVIRHSGWGLDPQWEYSDDATGARTFVPVINEPADLSKLRLPRVEYDPDATERNLTEARELFGDILNVRLKGVAGIGFHLMREYSNRRGLGNVMMDMAANPQMVHDAMSHFEAGYRGLIEQYVEQNLLDLNNDSSYNCSGGVSYTDELPLPDADPERVRPCDMWAFAEAQELAQVSPAMHEEFALQYERRLLAPFGLNTYGCCEDLTRKLDDVLTIPNLRRVSISPWADVAACAERLQDQVILSWKPHPAYLVGDFCPDKIRDYLREALDATRGCVMEMVLKDTHTCEHHPERFTVWTEIAQQLVAAY